MKGTLGLRVQDGSGRDYAVTCSHVVAPWWINPKNDRIDSPALPRDSAGQGAFGYVEDWAVLDLQSSNSVDAALITPFLGTSISNESLGLGETPDFINDIDQFLSSGGNNIGVEVHSWRGVLKGSIAGLSDEELFIFGNRTFKYSQLLGYKVNTQDGDSGSLVVEPASHRILGLHVGIGGGGLSYCVLFSNIVRCFAKYNLIIPFQ